MTTYPSAIETAYELPTIEPPLERYSTAAMATTGLGGAWVLVRGAVPFDLRCPLLATTGIPCPFCGITRLSDHVLHGDLVGAVTHDPGGLAVVAILAVLAVVGVVAKLGVTPRRWPSAMPVAIALVVALSVHWTTTLLGGGFVDR